MQSVYVLDTGLLTYMYAFTFKVCSDVYHHPRVYLPCMNQRSVLHDTVVCVEGGGLEDARVTNLIDRRRHSTPPPPLLFRKKSNG